MVVIKKKDFCVATGWADTEISISTSCSARGTIYRLSPDYQKLIFPDGYTTLIDRASFREIFEHLQKNKSIKGYSHCDVDNRFFPIKS